MGTSDAGKAQLAIVVMGVSGSGKTTIAQRLAARVDASFIEADDLHSKENVDRMAAGIPLTDDDRHPWLLAVRDTIDEVSHSGRGVVVACSALKENYREILRSATPKVRFLFLSLTPETLLERLETRAGHFMPASLLRSQLEALEPLSDYEVQSGGLTLDGSSHPEAIISAAAKFFG